VSKLGARQFLQSYTLAAKTSGNDDEALGNHIDHDYTVVLNGFSGRLTPAFINAFKAEHARDSEYIVPDDIVHAYAEQQSPPSWGLTRVSEHQLDLSAAYRYPDNAGEGVDVWVVDTGIVPTHTDFGGRAQMVKSFVDGEDAVDLNGHGTHCAGTIGSLTYGVAKKAQLRGVKVLDAQGSGTDSSVIAGIDYVAQNVRKGHTVLSMSLGGSSTPALDDAVNAAVNAGVVVVVAAGNDGSDACQTSPAGAKQAFAVAASDNTDTSADFTNNGKCVKVYAPGVDITSLWMGADGATNTISGTSMATPHVAGVAASLMSQKSYDTPADVYADLQALATKDALTSVPADTLNLLLFNGVSDQTALTA